MTEALKFLTFLKENCKKTLIKLSLICLVSITVSCSEKDSTTSVSASDNKSFNNRKYSKQEPIRPFGNLPDLEEREPESVEYYNNYINKTYSRLDENEEYLQWLHTQRVNRLNSGKRNDFTAETIPGYNTYYINKSKEKRGTNTPVSERRMKDIEAKIKETRKKTVDEVRVETIDEIDNYDITSPETPEEEMDVKVNSKDYDYSD